MKIDLQKYQDLVDKKYLSVQEHLQADLLIWNYTQKCQFERYWTDETMTARGLITDLEGNIKARPFKKFFNLEEHLKEDSTLPSLPLERFKVYDKLDGSLGILYYLPDGSPCIATRGSFISDQAIRATYMLRKELEPNRDHSHIVFDPKWTWLFEIIYPENRIVVDYGNTQELVLLACINTKTGEETPISLFKDIPFKKVTEYEGFTDLKNLKNIFRSNAEGFVICFESGVRAKVKYDEYVRLHRLVTGVNTKTIWDLLRNNQPFDELIERVPDEFYKWVKDTKQRLQSEFNIIEAAASQHFEEAKKLETRKEQAVFLMSDEHGRKVSSIVFKMLDKQPYEETIWKMIKPRAEKPWKEDIDA